MGQMWLEGYYFVVPTLTENVLATSDAHSEWIFEGSLSQLLYSPSSSMLCLQWPHVNWVLDPCFKDGEIGSHNGAVHDQLTITCPLIVMVMMIINETN